jgi:hypothetical protein
MNAVNYGGIGAVIGHEIGHGFDDQGRKSDGDGVLRDWWTAEDANNFKERADSLVSRYSKFTPLPNMHVNGQNTLGENIGDLGGLEIAHHAYLLSLKGKEAPVIDGLSGDQRFFLSFAQIWRAKNARGDAHQHGGIQRAQPGRVPRDGTSAEHGCVVRSIQCEARRQDVCRAGEANSYLVAALDAAPGENLPAPFFFRARICYTCSLICFWSGGPVPEVAPMRHRPFALAVLVAIAGHVSIAHAVSTPPISGPNDLEAPGTIMPTRPRSTRSGTSM